MNSKTWRKKIKYLSMYYYIWKMKSYYKKIRYITNEQEKK